MRVDAHDHVLEICDGIDLARLAAGDERIERGEMIAGFDVASNLLDTARSVLS